MFTSESKYNPQDLRIGMMVKAEQLTEIYNKYMILLFVLRSIQQNAPVTRFVGL